jgi:hypothetical protein
VEVSVECSQKDVGTKGFLPGFVLPVPEFVLPVPGFVLPALGFVNFVLTLWG